MYCCMYVFLGSLGVDKSDEGSEVWKSLEVGTGLAIGIGDRTCDQDRLYWTVLEILTGLQVVSQWNPTTKEIYHASVNACLAPLVSVDGKHVITVEGIGNVKRPHPTQERIAKSNGSQCGFCTPGIVMVRQVTGAYLLKEQ